jgi:hypothetical protein
MLHELAFGPAPPRGAHSTRFAGSRAAGPAMAVTFPSPRESALRIPYLTRQLAEPT